jgi:hypothetical protein
MHTPDPLNARSRSSPSPPPSGLEFAVLSNSSANPHVPLASNSGKADAARDLAGHLSKAFPDSPLVIMLQAVLLARGGKVRPPAARARAPAAHACRRLRASVLSNPPPAPSSSQPCQSLAAFAVPVWEDAVAPPAAAPVG